MNIKDFIIENKVLQARKGRPGEARIPGNCFIVKTTEELDYQYFKDTKITIYRLDKSNWERTYYCLRNCSYPNNNYKISTQLQGKRVRMVTRGKKTVEAVINLLQEHIPSIHVSYTKHSKVGYTNVKHFEHLPKDTEVIFQGITVKDTQTFLKETIGYEGPIAQLGALQPEKKAPRSRKVIIKTMSNFLKRVDAAYGSNIHNLRNVAILTKHRLEANPKIRN